MGYIGTMVADVKVPLGGLPLLEFDSLHVRILWSLRRKLASFCIAVNKLVCAKWLSYGVVMAKTLEEKRAYQQK